MTENNQSEINDSPKKKVSLQEAMRQQLANKKKQAANDNSHGNSLQKTQKMKSQQTKKVSNQRRKTGV